MEIDNIGWACSHGQRKKEALSGRPSRSVEAYEGADLATVIMGRIRHQPLREAAQRIY